jgi:hypothetical protein
MPGEEWRDEQERVNGYLATVDASPHRAEGTGVNLP